MNKRIILNSLPPANINSPSAALSILKSFMQKNGYSTEIKYWNFQIDLIREYTSIEETYIKIIPFLSILNDRSDNNTGNQRILSLMQELKPSLKTYGRDYYANELKKMKDKILHYIKAELQKIDFENILVFGISSKFHQWIPGIILAEEIKKISTGTKIVIGGFGSKEAAEEAMKMCKHFDFSVWGEGEYPLLSLCNQLNNSEQDFDKIPRISYREKEEIKQSITAKSEYLDFDNYILPDYSDYFKNYPFPEKKYQVRVPINSIRACYWNKCMFCDYNHGYKYRERSPENIVSEIEYIADKYDVTVFSFVDNDIFGNYDRFIKLLDCIIESRYKNKKDYNFWAEMIPNAMLNSEIIKKMAIAGFKHIFIGYDSISDSLLKKMNKSNSFSDNIFFVKHSLKNGINPVVNIIRGIYRETEEDVRESIDNLHFLRFFYNDNYLNFSQRYVSLVISTMTKYFKLLSEEEKKEYKLNLITYLLPDNFSNNSNKFKLFRWKKQILDNEQEWNKLVQTEEFYKKNKFSYKILENNNIHYYTEYCNGQEVNSIYFDEAEYWDTLNAANNNVCTFEEVFSILQKKYTTITIVRLQEILENLKSAYLLHCNKEFSSIISIIDTSLCD